MPSKNSLYSKLEKSIEENKSIVEKRIKEFEEIGKNRDLTFKELCFCILTANFSAKRGIEIQEKIGDGFLTLSESNLSKKLKELGYRYPNIRAKFIVEARKYRDKLNSLGEDFEAREWIVKNIKGLGWKESSHFLRNVGRKNLAIIDFHIIDLLNSHEIISMEKKPLTKKRYLFVENELRKIGDEFSLTLAELDLYLWAIETGEVLK